MVGDLGGPPHPLQFIRTPQVMVVGQDNPLQPLGKDPPHQLHGGNTAAGGVFGRMGVHLHQHRQGPGTRDSGPVTSSLLSVIVIWFRLTPVPRP